jgi:cytochrome c-type protein NapC
MQTESGQGGWLARVRRTLPGRIAFGIVAVVIVLMVVVGGFTTVVESTNSLEFCTSCHSMSYNYAEYKDSAHYSNKSGVRAVCSDCHVPKKNWYSEMYRKLIAARDVWEELVGDFSTKEKFDAQRWEMAQREWARMKESDSIGCRNCHSFKSMSLDDQSKGAKSKHADAETEGKTCIDCHKGVVHKLPRKPE